MLLLLCAACGGRTDLSLSDDVPAAPGFDASLADAFPSDGHAPDAPGPSSPTDAGAPGTLDAQPDAYASPAVAPCLVDTHVIYLRGDPGNGFFDGEGSLAGAQATWTSQYGSEAFAMVWATIDAGPYDGWEILLGASPAGGSLGPGEYDASFPTHSSPWMGLNINDASCGDSTGTFDILLLEAPPGDQVSLTRLLASFDVHCGGGAPDAMVHGCVRYEP